MDNDYKTLLVLEYLYTNLNRKNVIKFTLENMISECGYKVDSHKGKSVDKFKSILSILHDNKMISYERSISEYKYNDLIICTLTMDLTDKFTMLKYEEKDIILNQKVQETDNTKLLFYYCYLKCRMYKRAKSDGDVARDSGRAEACYPSFKKINEDTGITDDTINKYNKILVKLDLIRVGNVGHWYYKDDKMKNVKEGVNIYTLFSGDEEYAKYQIKETIKLYKLLLNNSNKVFTESRKYKNNIRKNNGYIGRVKYLQEHGKATQKQIDKMNSLIEFNSEKTEKVYKIKGLLDSEQEFSLSNIYFNLGKEEKTEYYEKIEAELGIYDIDTGEFLVEKNFYDWVISNYNDEEKDKFINIVKKHKKNKIAEKCEDKIEKEYWEGIFASYLIDDVYSEVEG